MKEKVYKSIVDENGCITIPKAICKALKLKAGDWLNWDLQDDGTIILTKSKSKKVRMTLELPDDLYKFLKSEAKRRKVSISFIVEEALVKFLDEHENS